MPVIPSRLWLFQTLWIGFLIWMLHHSRISSRSISHSHLIIFTRFFTDFDIFTFRHYYRLLCLFTKGNTFRIFLHWWNDNYFIFFSRDCEWSGKLLSLVRDRFLRFLLKLRSPDFTIYDLGSSHCSTTCPGFHVLDGVWYERILTKSPFDNGFLSWAFLS